MRERKGTSASATLLLKRSVRIARRLPRLYRRVRLLAPAPLERTRLLMLLARGFLEPHARLLRDGRLLRVQLAIGGRRHTLALRANGADVFTFYEIFLKGVYDACLPLRPAATILDLGANIGVASVYFKQHCPDAYVIAVEPELANFGMLVENVSGIGVQVNHAAVAARGGTGELTLASGPTAHSLAERTRGATAAQATPLVTLDDLAVGCGITSVDVLKVDIEGAEADVFAHRWRLLDVTAMVLVELHGGEAREIVVRRLTEEGFTHVVPPETGFPDVFTRVR